jgi:hypothetical protein
VLDADDLDQGVVALSGVPLQGGLLRVTVEGWPRADAGRTFEA